MTTTEERVAVVETKVDRIGEDLAEVVTIVRVLEKRWVRLEVPGKVMWLVIGIVSTPAVVWLWELVRVGIKAASGAP